MALRIIKLVVDAQTTTTTTTQPDAQHFFYELPLLQVGPSTLTIVSTDFDTDAGTAATALPALATNNSYYNVYINGVLQMEGNTKYTAGVGAAGTLEIDVAAGETILSATPVVLEVVNYNPASTSTTTVET